MEKKEFVCFRLKVDEVVRFQSRSLDNNQVADKDLIRCGRSFYLYVFNRNEKIHTYSLRQITEDEFITRKDDFLKFRGDSYLEEWNDGNTNYVVKSFYETTWKRDIPQSDCIFFEEGSPLKSFYQKVSLNHSEQKEAFEEEDRKRRYDYARKCGGIAQKLGISYVNVLRIGPEKGKLMQFKESYELALQKIVNLSITDLRQLHINLFRSGRERRKQAMQTLGISFFLADVNLLDLKELERAISSRLQNYAQTSIISAKENVLKQSAITREQMLIDLLHGNIRQKKDVLAQLGVEIEGVDLNRYPISELKKCLASSLPNANY